MSNVQEAFLNNLRKRNIPCTVILTNGARTAALIKAFDNFAIILDVHGKIQMQYKHMVSTIIPEEPIPLTFE